MMTIGEKVRQRRRALFWTQEQLAIAAGVAKQTVAFTERGITRPHRSTLELIWSALDEREEMIGRETI